MIDLELLRGYFDSEETVNKFLNAFKSETPLIIEKIDNSFRAGDFIQLGIDAHSLKSYLQYLNALESAQLAKEIEIMADSYDHSMRHLLSQKISILVARVKEINQYIETL